MKRKREHRKREEEDDVLDEDDLDLIGEQFGERPKPQTQVWHTGASKVQADHYAEQVQAIETRSRR